MAGALRGFGFKVIVRTDAGQREMRRAIREFGDELRRADVGLFYFAGHGLQVKGNNYLVPVGADIQIEAGYTNVHWFRGGTDARRGAGFRVQKVAATSW